MRILETEAMMSVEEVMAYDALVEKYLHILHAGFIETVINLSPEEGTFLDVGTGTGRISIGIAQQTKMVNIIALDLSPQMLQVAQRNAELAGVADKIEFRLVDAKLIPFEAGTFDSVFCHNMLHHIPVPLTLADEMKRVTKQGGAIVIRDLIRHSPIIAEIHVLLFGAGYNQLMKKEYRDSILAALSVEEWHDLFKSMRIDGGELTRQFVTHMTIQKPSVAKRPSRLPLSTGFTTSLLKRMYVSS